MKADEMYQLAKMTREVLEGVMQLARKKDLTREDLFELHKKSETVLAIAPVEAITRRLRLLSSMAPDMDVRLGLQFNDDEGVEESP